MNQRYDVAGFGAALLAAALFVWLGLAGPLFKHIDKTGIGRWLYEWQTFLGIGGAIGAAYIAAKPVWRQLSEMQKQSAMALYGTLSNRRSLVQADMKLVLDARAVGEHAKTFEKIYKKRAPQECVERAEILRMHEEELTKIIQAIRDMRKRIDEAFIGDWATPSGTYMRLEISQALLQLELKVTTFKIDLGMVIARTGEAQTSNNWLSDKAILDAYTVAPEAAAVQSACDRYLPHVHAEYKLLQPTIASLLAGIRA